MIIKYFMREMLAAARGVLWSALLRLDLSDSMSAYARRRVIRAHEFAQYANSLVDSQLAFRYAAIEARSTLLEDAINRGSAADVDHLIRVMMRRGSSSKAIADAIKRRNARLTNPDQRPYLNGATIDSIRRDS